MSESSLTHEGRENLAAGLFLSALSCVLALPSLWQAWCDDRYSVGGGIAFLLWLVSLWLAADPLHRRARQRVMPWIVLATLLCMLGSMTSLRICHHLALATAFGSLVVPALLRWLLTGFALCWIPATGWILSRFTLGGLNGWERPALASISIILSLYLVRRMKKALQPEK
jgi:hypothetical protein